MAILKDKFAKACVAEFVAMALFVWVGCGSAVATNSWGQVTSGGDLLTIAAAFGFSISLLAYSIGHISGGHINPAVTFGLFLCGEVDIKTLLGYFVAQFSGATVGILLLWACTASLTHGCTYESLLPVCTSSEDPSVAGAYGPPFGLGVNAVANRVSVGCAFFIELMGTFLLCFTVLHSAVHKKSTAGNAAPIAIGWSVMMAHIVMIPFTGCGINPARSFGPMIVNSFGGINTWGKGTWVFYVAPFVGAAAAAFVYKFLLEADDDEEGEDAKKDDGANDGEEQAVA